MDTIARGLALDARNTGTLRNAVRKIHLPARVRSQEVMASPPTVTFTTTNPLVSPFLYPSVYFQATPSTNRINPLFRYRKGSGPVMVGTGFPNYLFVRFTSTNYGVTLGKGANAVGVPVLTDASRVVFYVKGTTGQLLAKVDGQYVSLTPTTVPNDGAGYYYDLNFGSSLMREIELVCSGSVNFGGVYVAASDTVAPAPARGPRTIVLWDSFGEGTGASNIRLKATSILGDALGWDDVRSASVGATGMVATAGDKPVYRSRLATDVIPYAPDLVVVCTSINDTGTSPTAMTAEAAAIISQIKVALPNCQVVLTSMMSNMGAGHTPVNRYLVTDALSALAASLKVPFVNLLDQPLPEYFPATPTTLYAAATAGATSIQVTDILTPGATYKFADGTRFFARTVGYSAGAFTVTIDYLQANQSAGATITPCGNSLWVGAGKVGATTGLGNTDIVVGSDGTHPTDAGHLMIGTALAYGLITALA